MPIIDDIGKLVGAKPIIPPLQKRPSKKILIVEDEEPLLKILKDAFQRKGYITALAKNGQEGLDMIEKFKPDIVLLDLLMPVMDGRKMIIKLREKQEYKRLPVVVLTNAGDVDNIRVTRTLNSAIDFIVKSNVTIDEVVDRVSRLII